MSEQQDPQESSDNVKEKEASPTPPAAAHSSATGYMADLSEFFQPETIRSDFRILKSGLFVSQSCYEQFISGYQKWLEEKTGRKAPTRHKCIKRLFHEEEPELFYLIDGKHCLVGYSLQADLEPSKYSLPFCSGNVQDISTYLHPKDPVLQEIDGLEANLTSQGLELKMFAHNQTFFLEFSVIEKFTAIAQKSYKLKKIYGPAVKSLRSAIEPLMTSFKKARLVTKNKSLLIPASYRGNKSYAFFKLGSLVFVVEKDKLIDCYELAANNLYRFIRSECKMLASSQRNRKIGALQVNLGKRQQIGTIKTPENIFTLDLAPFQQFLELTILSSSSAHKNIKGIFTIRDCLKSFARLFGDSKWIEKKQLPSKIREHSEKSGTYRISGDFVFIITDKTTISSCMEKYPRQTRRPDRRQDRNRNRDRNNNRRRRRR